MFKYLKTKANSGLYDTQIIIALIVTAVSGSIGAVYVWEWIKTI